MGGWIRWAAAVAAGVLALAVTGAAAAGAATKPAARPQLHSFRSDAELAAFLKRRAPRGYGGPVAAPPSGVEEIVVTGSMAAPSITNNQEAGVDEGDIVKLTGDLLVVLRRGRLFTVSIAGGGLRPVDWIAAYPPQSGGHGWYDEMLVLGRQVVVIGYSYGSEATEISRFRIAPDGRLAFQDAYQLRSSDYYSSRNYASRLIGSKLIFYTPLYLGWSRNPLETMPAMRRWGREEPIGAFKRIAPPSRVFIPDALYRSSKLEIEALHTVTSCDLAAPVMTCEATGVLGPRSRNFYVSRRSVYVWASGDWDEDETPKGLAPSFLFRLPLSRAAPSALGVRGAPVDQFSFREDAADGALNVLVRSSGGGDAMWRSEFVEGAVALLRLPLSRFAGGPRDAPASAYRLLPRLSGVDDEGSFANRFVGDHVLYGAGRGWTNAGPTSGVLVAAPVRGGPARRLALEQGVDRIEVMGPSALVVGGKGDDLAFTAITLDGPGAPRVTDTYVLAAASEGETRSHAFFYRPDPGSPGGATGVLGLPVTRPGRPAYRQLFESSAAMLFLRRQPQAFARLGELAAAQEGFTADACVASCTDWYGNARPIFVGRRTFALLGYELVEGVVTPTGVSERARVNFAPKPSEIRKRAE